MRNLLSPASSESLLRWFQANQRDLPWRRVCDPYAILVSEVMLQQTQVATVLPYFEKWMALFPDYRSLAAASEQDVLSVWQGLGYYRRARNLHHATKHFVEHGIPASHREWLGVPGVGRYTAGAVTSIAFGFPEAVVDGNVARVYSRVAADPGVGQVLEENAWWWARKNLDLSDPGTWNQALMELGATICTPKKPACGSCPISENCLAFLSGGDPAMYPHPKPKKPTISVEHASVIPTNGAVFGVCQIPRGEWWEGMWQFPRFTQETGTAVVSESSAALKYLGKVLHTVTKHRIRLDVYQRTVTKLEDSLRWVDRQELAALPMPSPQRKAFALADATSPRLELT